MLILVVILYLRVNMSQCSKFLIHALHEHKVEGLVGHILGHHFSSFLVDSLYLDVCRELSGEKYNLSTEILEPWLQSY